MSRTFSTARLLFPHQLFNDFRTVSKDTLIIFSEDDLFFKQYKFHKQKLLLHRASMKAFADALQQDGYSIAYIESGSHSSIQLLADTLDKHHVKTVEYYDVCDDWLIQRLTSVLDNANVEKRRLESPSFLTSRGQIEDYFDHHPNRMQHFYQWQRKRLNILVEDSKPVGGKWSYDVANRKKLPKHIVPPAPYSAQSSRYVTDASEWVMQHFPGNPGVMDEFAYPITHQEAEERLQEFLKERLELFGPYEDAIAQQYPQMFHSVISPLLNNGLLTPQHVVEATLHFAEIHSTPIESLEGFIRQIIGWREYMRATYVRYGREMRTRNHLEHTRPLDKSWWTGDVGLEPVDATIRSVLSTGYAHHIERLMILGNAMLLLRIHPDEVYEWFMSLFIDAYDWVMVPNVYAMSQFAAGDKITTKPYISGSNYIFKMSDYKKGDWAGQWDALYWRFIADNRTLFENNYRSAIMVKLYDRQSDEKKTSVNNLSDKWLT